VGEVARLRESIVSNSDTHAMYAPGRTGGMEAIVCVAWGWHGVGGVALVFLVRTMKIGE